jgi:predicted CoA-binding protein
LFFLLALAVIFRFFFIVLKFPPVIGMHSYKTLIEDFLRQPEIAVAGISSSKQTVANAVFLKLRNGPRSVFAVGRNTVSFADTRCYPNIAALPVPVQGVFIAARPENVRTLIMECIEQNVPRVWVHNMSGTSAPASSGISEDLVQLCRTNGITLIPGACPMMFAENADLGHRCIKWFLSVTGALR